MFLRNGAFCFVKYGRWCWKKILFAQNARKERNEGIYDYRSKNGRDVSGISEFNGNFVPDNQQEVLFTNNTTFHIDKTIYTGNVVWVKMTEL